MLSIRNSLNRAAAAGAVAVVAAGLAAPSATAHAATVALGLTNTAPAAAGPNTNILGRPPRWSPTKLTVQPFTGTCSATNNSFSITSQEKQKEALWYRVGTGKKKPFMTIEPGERLTLCSPTPKGTRVEFYISGSTSVLTVTFT